MGRLVHNRAFCKNSKSYLELNILLIIDMVLFYFQPAYSARGLAATPDLQELPFTPVHAPIMATVPGMQR